MFVKPFHRMLLAVLFVGLTISAAWGAEAPTTQPADQTTLVPVPPELQKDIPSARTRAELRAVVGRREKPASSRPLNILLLAGAKDHGPGEHDYPAFQKSWQRLLSKAENTKVTTAWEKPTDEQVGAADVVVIFKHTAWPKESNESIDKLMARGGGIVLLHWAVEGGQNAEHVGRHLGLIWGPGSKYRHGWLDLKFEDKKDEILRGLAGRTLKFHDEAYWHLSGDPTGIDLLATSMEDEGGKKVPVPLVWNRQVGKGRVHVNILGHYNWTFNDPLFRVLALRGIAWAAGEPVDRFAPLVTIDVDLARRVK